MTVLSIFSVTQTAQTEEKLVAMNEALMLGSVRQHELTEAAQTLNARLEREIVERKRAEVLLNAQTGSLQLLAEGAPLREVLEFLTDAVEHNAPEGLLASIVPLNEAGTRFKRGVGASLPDAFKAAFEGMEVSSTADLCAHAVAWRAPVAAPNFSKEERWQAFAEFVAPYELQAGWCTPIIASSGQVLGTFANYYRRVGDPTPPNRELVDVVVRIAALAIEVRQTETAKRDVAARLQVFADNIPILCWTANTEGDVFWYNQGWYDYTGATPQSQRGWGWQSVHDPKMLPLVMKRWKASLATGEPFEMVFPLKGADGAFRPFLTRIVPLRNDVGLIVQWFGTNTDISNERKAEERQRLLMNELAHRGRNLLAVIQAIAARTLLGTRSMAEAREALTNRIHALARSQTVLMNDGFEYAPLAEIIRLEVEAFSDRVSAGGPDVMLKPKIAQTFALLVHELATNATKHGALSQDSGRVSIRWTVDHAASEPEFCFQWLERGGPPAKPPTREGFGRMLLEKVVAQDFGAPPEMSFAPEGLSYEIRTRLSVVTARSGEEQQFFSVETLEGNLRRESLAQQPA